jgi:5-methylcytosine-specific restriction protein A
MIVLGVDPGLTGGIAALGDNGELLFTRALPFVEGQVKYLNAQALRMMFIEFNITEEGAFAFVERAQPMPKQGITSTFNYGLGFGSIRRRTRVVGRVYDLREWRRVRLEQLAREPFCRECRARGSYVPAQHVDHIVSIESGGAWFDADNLQSLCAPCHSVKTRADEGATTRAWQPGCDAAGIPLDHTHPWNKR